MSYVNFVINSDFKWALFGIALLWAFSLVLFWIENRADTDRALLTNHRKKNA